MAIAVRRIHRSEGLKLRAARLAALSDAPLAFAVSYDVELLRPEGEWCDRAALSSDGEGSATFLALDGDDAVGLVSAYRRHPGDAQVELVSMWTAPSVRRRGVGRALVAAAIDWAGATGAGTVALWVTRGNHPARRLYESIGFEVTGENQPLPSDPCKHEVRMVLRLGGTQPRVRRPADCEEPDLRSASG